MKFLCMTCDSQMAVVDNQRQREDGTLAIVLECPECFGQIGMLTNPMETKMLDALDVSVCPVGGKGRKAEADATPEGATCPAAGLMSGASSEAPSMEWTPDATKRLENLPSFVRSMVQQGIESFARDHGHHVVDGHVMDLARAKMGL